MTHRAAAFVVASLCAGLLWPEAAAALTAADGEAAFQGGRFADARVIWTELAVRGDPEAELGLGYLYDLGAGVAADARQALEYYRRAADSGLPAASFNVAVMLDSGRGMQRDPEAAALWYARAAAAGHGRAQFNLGQLYEAGDGVPHNPAVASAWYVAAAASGVRAAAGRKVAPEPPRASAPGRADPPRPDLIQSVPLTPVGDLRIATGATTALVPLVWSAPAQATPVSFFVEVDASEADEVHETTALYVDTSATSLRLGPGHYYWRVSVVGRTLPHYVASAWTEFTVVAG